MKKIKDEKNRGFTITEILVATFIFSLLVMGVYGVFNKSQLAWERGNLRIEQYRKIRGIFDLLTRELRCAFVSPANPDLFFEGEENSLYFFSSSNIAKEKGEYDLKFISYRFKDSKIIKNTKSNFKSPSTKTSSTVLASDVRKLSFSYFNGKNWQEKWRFREDKSRNFSSYLPEAVRITVTVGKEDETPLTFSTTVLLPVK
ncbi:prepilin-type N-terminal cleavage/methylation domain-containing protein [Candidatus Aerophobetes bacterium]|nr:prepilin-type N-terminal cleavage/methylation domain-containing protein [Candidatus Aerophobetes bacterium]